MTTTQLNQFVLTSRFWTFLAIFWIIRGTDVLITGAGYGYSWLKHGFPAHQLRVISGVRYSSWVKLACFIIGLVILIRQHRHKKAQTDQPLTERV